MKITKSQLKSLIKECIIEEQFNNFKKRDLPGHTPGLGERMPSCWEDFDELAGLFKEIKKPDQLFTNKRGRAPRILLWFNHAFKHTKLMNRRFRDEDYIEYDRIERGKNPELADGYNALRKEIGKLKGLIENDMNYLFSKDHDYSNPYWNEDIMTQKIDERFENMLQIWDNLQEELLKYKDKRYKRNNPLPEARDNFYL